MLVLLPLCWAFAGTGKLRVIELGSFWSPVFANGMLALATTLYLHYLHALYKTQSLTIPRFLFSGTIFIQVALATLVSQIYSGIFFIATHCVAALAISALAAQPIDRKKTHRQSHSTEPGHFFTFATAISLVTLLCLPIFSTARK